MSLFGRRSAASATQVQTYCETHSRPHNFDNAPAAMKALPHEIPTWIKPEEHIYFITINCRERLTNQLALPEIASQIFETVRYRQDNNQWWPYIFLLLPDHLHALISFASSDKPIQTVVSKWKERVAKEVGIDFVHLGEILAVF